MNGKPTYNYTKRIEQTFSCGCHIDEMLDGSYGITYCQKHAAAPELYEALKDADNALCYKCGQGRDCKPYECASHLRYMNVILKAEGG